MTAYDTLQKAVNDAQNAFNAANAELVRLKNDPTYLRNKSILADPRVINDPNSWIASTGEWWNSVDAPAARRAGQQYVNEQNARIAAQTELVALAKKDLDDARKALTDYERNSPIGQQAAQNKMEEGKNKRTVIIIVVLGLTIVIVTGVIMYVKKRNKVKA